MTAATAEAPAGLTVRVEAFEGPLDLLLHLCRTHEVDLARLPVRTITDQYLAHLESVRFQDLEMAGSFMVMAATLIYLKSKLLVPDTEGAQDDALDEEGELLRRELAERLQEYARIKTLGGWLAQREAEQALLFGRTVGELPPPEEIPLEDLSVHLLQRAMARLIQVQKQQAPREVEASRWMRPPMEEVSVLAGPSQTVVRSACWAVQELPRPLLGPHRLSRRPGQRQRDY